MSGSGRLRVQLGLLGTGPCWRRPRKQATQAISVGGAAAIRPFAETAVDPDPTEAGYERSEYRPHTRSEQRFLDRRTTRIDPVACDHVRTPPELGGQPIPEWRIQLGEADNLHVSAGREELGPPSAEATIVVVDEDGVDHDHVYGLTGQISSIRESRGASGRVIGPLDGQYVHGAVHSPASRWILTRIRMSRDGGAMGRKIRRARRVEPFVRQIVGGGLALVVGLWFSTLATAWSPLWLVGVALSALGVGGLVSGIWSQVEY